METLLEDYKRKLNNVKELIEKQRSNGCIVHQRREERLNTKAAEYRAFIVDIERAMARQQQQNYANCAIFDVSQRSELLKAFICWNNKHNGIAQPVPEKMADNYLKSL